MTPALAPPAQTAPVGSSATPGDGFRPEGPLDARLDRPGGANAGEPGAFAGQPRPFLARWHERTALHLHLVAHGSPDPRHAASVRRTARRVQRAAGAAVTVSFLEHDEPRTSVALTPRPPRWVTAPDRTTVVVPLLLTAGVHWHRDLPPVIGPMGQRSILLAPPEPAQFADAVFAAARPAVATGGRVVLATAGSSRPEVRQRMRALAGRIVELGQKRDLPRLEVVVAERPDAVASLARPGDAVVPVLIADGVFADRIRAAARRQDATVTPVLGETDGFAIRVLDLVTVAAA